MLTKLTNQTIDWHHNLAEYKFCSKYISISNFYQWRNYKSNFDFTVQLATGFIIQFSVVYCELTPIKTSQGTDRSMTPFARLH